MVFSMLPQSPHYIPRLTDLDWLLKAIIQNANSHLSYEINLSFLVTNHNSVQ